MTHDKPSAEALGLASWAAYNVQHSPRCDARRETSTLPCDDHCRVTQLAHDIDSLVRAAVERERERIKEILLKTANDEVPTIRKAEADGQDLGDDIHHGAIAQARATVCLGLIWLIRTPPAADVAGKGTIQ